VCTALAELLPGARIVVREHRDDLRRAAVATRLVGGELPDAEAVVEGREFGVVLPLRPFAGLATGIYVDQRGTRRWLRPQAAGRRVLNLFAYTGLFSLSLLQAGAASAVDVDLSAPALARGAEAAARNGLADRHRQHHGDCIEFLLADRSAYDVIISDPPTAAPGGEGGWVSRRDHPRLLSAALPRLAPGGLLVMCSNTIGGKAIDLEELLHEAAGPTRLDGVAAPDLDPDIPQAKGFPEGQPFRLLVARRPA
jgi:23S rRNA G2069 N7-methylase RlmK/C1962 C5-methylase RlmI